jgi:hypothetical protein
MTRIQYEIPDDVHQQAKIGAAQRGVTLKDYIVAALAAFNQQQRGKQS